MLKVEVWLPVVLLILAVIATIIPLSSDPVEIDYKMPILICVVVLEIVGEVIRVICSKRDSAGGTAAEKSE